MKLAALISVIAWAASAQTYEIRGVLLEKATERPVKGSLLVDPVGYLERTQTVATNASGEFQLHVQEPGAYSLQFQGNDQYRPAFVIAELAAGDRSKNVRVLLERLGKVAGRVLDESTGAPVQNAPVTIMQVRWIKGRMVTDEQPINPDAEGRFQGSGDRAWPWVVAIMPRFVAPSSDSEHVMTKFTKEDVDAVDEDYEESYWPGGVRALGEALPAPYISDQTTDIGNIRVRKMKYRRALVHFPMTEGCFADQPFRAKFMQPRDELRDFNLYCGHDQLLRGLIPGMQYRFEITPLNQLGPDAWRTGILEFVVGDKNPELRVTLNRGVDLEGRLIFADGLTPPRSPVQFTLRHGDLWQERRLDKEGRFKFTNVPLGEQEFQVVTGGSFYAQHVRINGVETQGLIHKFEWTGQGTLEVVIDDQPGVIAGSVTDGSRAVGLAVVTAVPWPVPAGKSIFDVRYDFAASVAGTYRIGALPPGSYRVVAVRGESKERLEEPGVLEQLLSRGEKVTLGRGSTATLDVRVVELK